MGKLKNIRKIKMIAQEGRCYYCNLPMWDDFTDTVSSSYRKPKEASKVLRCTAEHLQPRSEGGGDTANNIVAACLFCNTRRHRRKEPLSPEAHRHRVRQRMAAGKWLAAKFPAKIVQRRPSGH